MSLQEAMIEDNNHEVAFFNPRQLNCEAQDQSQHWETMAVANIDRGAQESLHGPSSSNRSNLRTANLRKKMRQLSMVTNDTQWWLLRGTAITLVWSMWPFTRLDPMFGAMWALSRISCTRVIGEIVI